MMRHRRPVRVRTVQTRPTTHRHRCRAPGPRHPAPGRAGRPRARTPAPGAPAAPLPGAPAARRRFRPVTRLIPPAVQPGRQIPAVRPRSPRARWNPRGRRTPPRVAARRVAARQAEASARPRVLVPVATQLRYHHTRTGHCLPRTGHASGRRAPPRPAIRSLRGRHRPRRRMRRRSAARPIRRRQPFHPPRPAGQPRPARSR